MKKLLKITIVIIFANCYFASSAQIFGIQAGFNFASQVWEFGGVQDDTDKKILLGINLGGTVDFDLGNNLGLQTGIFINQKGVKFEGVYGRDDTYYKDKWRLTYLDIPLHVKYNIPVSQFNLYFYGGPYIGFIVGGSYVWIDGAQKGTEAMNIGNDELNDDFIGADIGLNIGGGIEFGAFGVGMQYSIGLLNIEPGGDENNNVHNRVFSIFATYKFGK